METARQSTRKDNPKGDQADYLKGDNLPQAKTVDEVYRKIIKLQLISTDGFSVWSQSMSDSLTEICKNSTGLVKMFETLIMMKKETVFSVL